MCQVESRIFLEVQNVTYSACSESTTQSRAFLTVLIAFCG
jgi:hypothetical protein